MCAFGEGATGHERDTAGLLWRALEDRLVERLAVHDGHHDVAKNEVVELAPLDAREGLSCVGQRLDSVLGHEQLPKAGADVRFVVHDEHPRRLLGP